MEFVFGLIKMPADDLIITGVFIFVVLVYLLSTVIILLLPAMMEIGLKLKVLLCILSFLGCMAIMLKYAAGYHKYVALTFAIIYACVYPVILFFFHREKRKSEEEAERLLKMKMEKGLEDRG